MQEKGGAMCAIGWKLTWHENDLLNVFIAMPLYAIIYLNDGHIAYTLEINLDINKWHVSWFRLMRHRIH